MDNNIFLDTISELTIVDSFYLQLLCGPVEFLLFLLSLFIVFKGIYFKYLYNIFFFVNDPYIFAPTCTIICLL